MKQSLLDALDSLKDWVATLIIGFLAVSYWRSTWTLLDIWCCDQPHDASLPDGTTFCFAVDAGVDDNYAALRRDGAVLTYFIGLGLTATGVLLMWLGLWSPGGTAVANDADGKNVKVSIWNAALRFIIVYILGAAAVCMWRGVWYLTDYLLLPNKVTDGSKTYGLEVPLASYWVSSLVGAAVTYILCAGGSLLATPAIFLIDGPGINPPPLAITIISSYYSLALPAGAKPPKLPLVAIIMDAFVSFVCLPIFVVWYWRGTWLLLDNYLWKFSPYPHDLHLSMAWSTIMAAICMGLTCEPIISRIPSEYVHPHELLSEVFGRLRTFILALGTVNFWRVVWYVWDEFLGGTTLSSAWTGHAVPVVCLTIFGCLACITAPPATLGVDAVPHPDSAEEPLFSLLPIAYELLFLFGIGRQPLSKEALMEAAKEELDRMEPPPPPPPTAEGGEIEMSQVRVRRTYFEIQRRDLDNRLSASVGSSVRTSLRSTISLGSVGSLRSSGGTLRRHNSSFYRNR